VLACFLCPTRHPRSCALEGWHIVLLSPLWLPGNYPYNLSTFGPSVAEMTSGAQPSLVLATDPGNPPAVRVWTAKMVRFCSRTLQKPEPQTLGGPNPDPYLSTWGFCRVWLDPSVKISGSAFRVSHLWSHSDMRLLIIQYWPWYVTVGFRRISCLDVQNKNTQAPNYILKMSVNRASTIFGLTSSVLWVVRDHRHP